MHQPFYREDIEAWVGGVGVWSGGGWKHTAGNHTDLGLQAENPEKKKPIT